MRVDFENLYNRGTINRFNKHHYHNSKADKCTRHIVAWRKNVTKCKEEKNYEIFFQDIYMIYSDVCKILNFIYDGFAKNTYNVLEFQG